jgi:hypothetical protein
MEVWPLIRAVRLYVKAPVLSTGAVIVDLPGMQDSNVARANVASKYLEKCSAIWIVAPITRAVDDQLAIKLLGDSFRRQLQMDGRFGDITFICSKTDDFLVDEIEDSLGLDEMLEPLRERDAGIDSTMSSLRKEIQLWKDTERRVSDRLDELDELDEDLVDMRHSAKSKHISPKRKQESDDLSFQPTKRQFKISDKGSDKVGQQLLKSENGDSDDIWSIPPAERMVEEIADQNKRYSLSEQIELRKQEKEISSRIRLTTAKLQKAQGDKQEIQEDIERLCVEQRNLYSKDRIKQDFASGIQQLDQVGAEEYDENDFDPDADMRDYNQIADSLSVFCVSSRAYQKLKGRFRKDSGVKGFKDIEDTEIPQLQHHCLGLTRGERMVTCRRFLNSFNQLRNSLLLRSLSKGPVDLLCKEQREERNAFLENRLNNLHSVCISNTPHMSQVTLLAGIQILAVLSFTLPLTLIICSHICESRISKTSS